MIIFIPTHTVTTMTGMRTTDSVGRPCLGSEKKVKARILLILTALLWSSGGLLIKSISMGPMSIAGGRSIIAAAVILVYLRRPRVHLSVPQIGGAAAYAATVILFVLANKFTTAANAIVLQYTSPIYVAVMGALFLGEHTGRRGWIAVAVACGGMVLFFFDRLDAGGMRGNLCALASGVSFAALAVFLRMQKDGSPVESVLLGNLLSALICLPFMAGSEPSLRDLVLLLILGVFQLAIPYICYAVALKEVPALDAMLIPIIEPLLNPLWVFLIVGETPGCYSLIGSAVVLGAVVYYNIEGVEKIKKQVG